MSTSRFKCSLPHQGGTRTCGKIYNRQCDLTRHQLNHTKPVACQECTKHFPSIKDRERHFSTKHAAKKRYLCTVSVCKESNLIGRSFYSWAQNWEGFTRKDHWQAHMKTAHNLKRWEIEEAKRSGIPTAVGGEKDEYARQYWVAGLIERAMPKKKPDLATGEEVLAFNSMESSPASLDPHTLDALRLKNFSNPN